MKKLILLFGLLLLLSGCSSVEETECNGLKFRGRCQENTMDFCDKFVNSSSRDGERNESDLRAFKQCISDYSGYFKSTN